MALGIVHGQGMVRGLGIVQGQGMVHGVAN
jgi:hypothetical protein